MVPLEVHVDMNDSNAKVGNSKMKLDRTILDNFSRLVHPQEKVRIKSGVNLLKHLTEKEDETRYALGRIIRGLGSSTSSARTGFYTTLVALFNLQEDISIANVFEHVNKELHKSGSNTKAENADICVGQILVCGAIIRSRLWAGSSDEEQTKVLELLVKAHKERSYLGLLAFKFINEVFEKLEKDEFQRMFPFIQDEISKPWVEQNLDSLYLLYCIQKQHPSVINSKFLRKTIGCNNIISEESLDKLIDVLMTLPRISSLNHPIYEIISKEMATSELLPQILNILDQTLELANRNKLLLIIQIFSVILKNIKNTALIPDLLTKNFLREAIISFKSIRGQNEDADFLKNMRCFFDALLDSLKRDQVESDTKICVLRKLLFYPGTFLFEKVTRSKIVQHITLSLDKDGVKKLAKVYKGVVDGTERIDSQSMWLNNDRLYAAHLLVKLLNHGAVKEELEWKAEHLGFLMNLGLLKIDDGSNVGSELAASLKAAFFGSLALKLSKLEDLQTILANLVHNLDAKINSENLESILRNPISQEQYTIWQKTINAINKIEKKKNKSQNKLKLVFLTLFLHMGLQMFNDTELACESLNELFVCYEKARKKLKTDDAEAERDANDPLWTAVVIDLFLNLLSRNSQLFRMIIKCVFPHLCQYVTSSTLRQILSVFDPQNEESILSRKDATDSDESDEEETATTEKESEEDETDNESEAEDETVNDKLRMALHQVLSSNGYQTDEESIDMDKMSDTEGERLDTALAEVFKQFRPNRGRYKKQSKNQETLTHFRVRVLDLIEIYLESTPSMILTFEIMLPLLQALEFSVRDEHQMPLLNRLKSCLKKLSMLKKFSDTGGVDEAGLRDLLVSLLEKGTKNAIIVQEMGVQLADCCIFIIRCSDLVTGSKKTRKRIKRVISEIVAKELESYFHKRDCLTPIVLFKNIIQLTWDGLPDLVPSLLQYIFKGDVKPFKKNQAAELLKLFYTNQRYISTDPDAIKEVLASEHAQFSNNVIELFKSLCINPDQKNVKEKFLCSLFHLMSAMKSCRLNIDNMEWSEIAERIREYRSNVSFSKDAKTAFNKLCAQLGVSHIVQMKPKVVQSDGVIDADAKSHDEIQGKKNKKKSKTNKHNLKLKKEAKELRLQSLSEGFANLDFGTVEHIQTVEGINSAVGDAEESKGELGLGKINGEISGKLKKRKKTNSECVEIDEDKIQNGTSLDYNKSNSESLDIEISTSKKKKKKVSP